MSIKPVLISRGILTGAAEGEASTSDLAVRAPMTVTASMAASCNAKLSSVVSNVRKVTLALPISQLVPILVQCARKRDATGTLKTKVNLHPPHNKNEEITYKNGQHIKQLKFGIQAPGILLRLQRETDLFPCYQYYPSPQRSTSITHQFVRNKAGSHGVNNILHNVHIFALDAWISVPQSTTREIKERIKWH